MNPQWARWVSVLVVLGAVMGLWFVPSLQSGSLPLRDELEWRAVWRDPGLSAEQMDDRFAQPLVRRLKSIGAVLSVEAHSRIGETEIRLAINDPDVAERVDSALANDAAIAAPDHRRIEAYRQGSRLVWTIAGGKPDKVFWDWLHQHLVPGLRALNGVEDVRLLDEPDRQIEIRVDSRRLSAAGLTPLDVVRTVRNAARSAMLGTVPGLASLSMALPGGGSAPLSTFVEFRIRSAQENWDGSPLRLAIAQSAAATPSDVGERADLYFGWLRGNGLLPLGVRIERQQAKPAAGSWAKQGAAVGSFAALAMCGLFFFGRVGGGRWVAAMACAVLVTLGLLAAAGESFNEISLAAMALGLSAAGTMVLAGGLQAVDDRRQFQWMWLLVCLVGMPSLLLMGSHLTWALARAFVLPYAAAAIVTVVAAEAFGVLGTVAIACCSDRDRTIGAVVTRRFALTVRPELVRALLFAAVVASTVLLVRTPVGHVMAGESAAETWPGAGNDPVPDWRLSIDIGRAEFFGLAPDDIERVVRITKNGATVLRLDGEEGAVRVQVVSSDAAAPVDRIIVGGEIRDRPQLRVGDVAQPEEIGAVREIHRRYPPISAAHAGSFRLPDGTVRHETRLDDEPWENSGLWVLGPAWLLGATLAALVMSMWSRKRRGGKSGRAIWAVQILVTTWPAVAVCGVVADGVVLAPTLVSGVLIGFAAALLLAAEVVVSGNGKSSVGAYWMLLAPLVAAAAPWLIVASSSYYLMPLSLGILFGTVLLAVAATIRRAN